MNNPAYPINRPIHHKTAIAQATAVLLFGAVAGLASTASFAQSTLAPVVVTSTPSERVPATRITDDIAASPASVSVLDRSALDRLSISTYGDMFRDLTGVFVNDYGQGLVAYEVKIRGFGSGHGRDIAFSLDGVPLNITGSQHTNGYADLAQIIAETVNRVEVVRGPFSVTSGNHAVAGSVNIFTDNNTPSLIKTDIDSNGRVRVVPIVSSNLGPGHLLLAADLTKGNGYQNQTDLRRTNVFARYSMRLADGQASVRLQHYDATAQAPGYIDFAKVQSGAISPRAALAPGIGDAKKQSNLVFNYQSDDSAGAGGWASGWQGTVYFVRDNRSRYTYFDLNNSIGNPATLGAERDLLSQNGFNISKTTAVGSKDMPAQLLVGLQYSREGIDAINFAANSQQISLGNAGVTQQRDVDTRTSALFAQYQISPVRGLKLQAGARYDSVAFDIRLKPLDAAFGVGASNNFNNRKSQFSPKLGFAYALSDGAQPTEVFANVARGLKSPYPYGDFNRLPDTSITPLLSNEIGLQGTQANANWRIALWRTKQDKEALFNAANQFIGNQRTDRNGFDIEGGYALSSSTRLTANYSAVSARVRGQGVNDRISNVPDWTAGLGIEGQVNAAAGRFDWSVKDVIVGPQPLLADNSARTQTYHRVTARVGFAPASLKNSKFAVSLTHYNRPFEETRFDFGGGQFGISAKPRWQALLSAQYAF